MNCSYAQSYHPPSHSHACLSRLERERERVATTSWRSDLAPCMQQLRGHGDGGGREWCRSRSVFITGALMEYVKL